MVSKNDKQLEETSVGHPKVSLRLIILVLFFLSGVAALICEVVWMRMLTLVFGATTFATSTILASFFAGLALGSFYFGRVIDRGRNPLKVYALLTAGIGVFAFLMPLIFSGLDNIYVNISQHFNINFYLFSLIRFALSFLVLLIPTTLMGGTLPVLTKFLVKTPGRLGWNISNLYSINTFGAVVGSLSAGFFLIVVLGVKESTYVAGVMNFLIAGTVLALNRSLGIIQTADSNPKKSEEEQQDNKREAYSSKIARLALWAAGVSGFCALAYEVFWTRALVFFLDNTTHAFTTMLTTFLLGLALGSFIIARFIDTRRKPLALLGLIEILIGLSAILAIPVFGNLGAAFESIAGVPESSMTYWQWTGMRFIRSISIMLVPTFLMGMTFPLFIKVYARNLKMVGSAIGNVYSINTIGGVFGSVIAGFVLIPLIGIRQSIILIASINVVIGGILILYEPLMRYKNKLKMVVGLGLLFVSIGVIFLTIGQITFSSRTERMEATEILYYKEGIGATVKVYKTELGNKTISIDGFPVAGTSSSMQDIQMALGHLPLLLSNAPSPSVNIIGFGAGGTSWGVMQYNVKQVDCVELVPAVVDAAEWFPEINHDVLNAPKFNLIMGDGRNYSLVTDKKYDVISIDATSPKCAGNGSLYALEFYELCKQRLSKDGLIAQWLPHHLLSDEEVKMIARTFKMVFPHTTLWFTPARGYCILVGTQEKLEIDFKSLSGKLEMSNIQQELEQINITDPFDFLSCFVMGEEALTKFIGDGEINTDNHPYLEFTPTMSYSTPIEYYVQNMLSIIKFREDVFPLLVNIGETDVEIASVRETLQRRFAATEYNISGLVLFMQGRLEEAIVEYHKALVIEPEDEWTKHYLELAKSELKGSYFYRGIMYIENGMLNEAINVFKKAIEIDQNFVAAHYALAICYIDEGIYEEAKLELIKVLELWPQHEGARYALEMLEGFGF